MAYLPGCLFRRRSKLEADGGGASLRLAPQLLSFALMFEGNWWAVVVVPTVHSWIGSYTLARLAFDASGA